MQNIVQKHIAEAPEANDEGLVAIEYVVAAGLVAAGVAVVFATGPVDQDERQAQRPVHLIDRAGREGPPSYHRCRVRIKASSTWHSAPAGSSSVLTTTHVPARS